LNAHRNFGENQLSSAGAERKINQRTVGQGETQFIQCGRNEFAGRDKGCHKDPQTGRSFPNRQGDREYGGFGDFGVAIRPRRILKNGETLRQAQEKVRLDFERGEPKVRLAFFTGPLYSPWQVRQAGEVG
jgi:hypothetical protein